MIMISLEKLRELQGTYLFHGSSTADILVLEPRQAYSHQKPDGIPAVAASEHLEPAIFMAVLGSHYVGGWDGRDGEFGFYISKQAMEQAQREQWYGFVYALDKKHFHQHIDWEWRALVPIKPLYICKVGMADLPKNIALRD